MRLIDIEDVSLLKCVASQHMSAKALWRRINQQPTIEPSDEAEHAYCVGWQNGEEAEATRHQPKQGRWFKDDEGTFICSACGSGYKDQPTLMGKPMFDFCPICGARMVTIKESSTVDQTDRWQDGFNAGWTAKECDREGDCDGCKFDNPKVVARCEGCCRNYADGYVAEQIEMIPNANQQVQCVESVETMSCQECEHWKYIGKEWQCETIKCQGYKPKTDCAWKQVRRWDL